jgi:hypothetical protein
MSVAFHPDTLGREMAQSCTLTQDGYPLPHSSTDTCGWLFTMPIRLECVTADCGYPQYGSCVQMPRAGTSQFPQTRFQIPKILLLCGSCTVAKIGILEGVGDMDACLESWVLAVQVNEIQ